MSNMRAATPFQELDNSFVPFNLPPLKEGSVSRKEMQLIFYAPITASVTLSMALVETNNSHSELKPLAQ